MSLDRHLEPDWVDEDDTDDDERDPDQERDGDADRAYEDWVDRRWQS